jgi:RHS repeat-associated protein
MRFPGQRWDSATGLNYNYYRDFEPSTGRYSQSDPIGLEGGISTYGYANASPLVYADPDGLIPGKIIGFIAQRALPRLGLRWGAGYAVRKAGARVARKQIERVAEKRAARQSVKQPSSCDPPVKRSGPRGVDPDHHNANVLVRDINGKVVQHERVISGNMTPAEKALGFPKNTLASHTEASRLLKNSLLAQPGMAASTK